MTNLLHISIAYRLAALQLMTAEAGYFSQQLHLHVKLPITPADVSGYVSPPRMGFGGTLKTTNVVFAFNQQGQLWSVYCHDGFQLQNPTDIQAYPRLTALTSIIDEAGAYHLATQWLASVQFDVVALEKKYGHRTWQEIYYDPPLPLDKLDAPPASSKKIPLPIFQVAWGAADIPPVQVTVFGATKELIEIRAIDTSLSRRPSLVVTNALVLDAIPDPPKALPGR